MKKLMALAFLAVGISTGMYAEDTCAKSSTHSQGDLPTCIAFDAATSEVSSSIIDTMGFRVMSVRVWAATNSVATVNVYCRNVAKRADGTSLESPWVACAQPIVNPDNSTNQDFYVTLPRAYQYYLSISGYGSGSISAIFERQSQ